MSDWRFGARAEDGARFLEHAAARVDLAELQRVESAGHFGRPVFLDFDELLAPLREREFPSTMLADLEVSVGYCAAKTGHVEIVRLLLARGADATATDHSGMSALYWCAMRCDSPDTIDLLVAAGAPLDGARDAGYTPLYSAATMSHPGAVRALLRHGADAEYEHPEYGTALEYVLGTHRDGWEEIAALLRAATEPGPLD